MKYTSETMTRYQMRSMILSRQLEIDHEHKAANSSIGEFIIGLIIIALIIHWLVILALIIHGEFIGGEFIGGEFCR